MRKLSIGHLPHIIMNFHFLDTMLPYKYGVEHVHHKFIYWFNSHANFWHDFDIPTSPFWHFNGSQLTGKNEKEYSWHVPAIKL